MTDETDSPVARGAVVLCGGRSRRMGRDKATLPFGDEVMLQRVVRLLADVVDEIVVVARPGQELPALPDGVRVTYDDVPDQGPLGGLVPGLREARAPAVYATGCDVPFLEPRVVDLLFDRLGDSAVAVAEAEGYTHPLCAVYRTDVRPPLERLLAAGRLRPVFLYDEVETVRVGDVELRTADPDLLTLSNLNTPEAYEAALARAGHSPRRAVRVEFYDVARARAGVAFVDVEATTLGEAVRAAAAAYPGLVPDVIRDGALCGHWRASRNGREFLVDASAPLAPGDALLILSALAGG